MSNATTTCWNCNHVYPMDDQVCPECNATNANMDLETAQKEMMEPGCLIHGRLLVGSNYCPRC